MSSAAAYLSPHFSLAELTASQAAERAGIANTPDAVSLENLRRLALTLEGVRGCLGGVAMLVSSGYRSPAVNNLVGGSLTSAHKDGRAADFIAPRCGTPLEICQRIVHCDIVFDQLIYEGTWVHFGIAVAGAVPRRQVLTAVFRPGQATQYVKGLP